MSFYKSVILKDVVQFDLYKNVWFCFYKQAWSSNTLTPLLNLTLSGAWADPMKS